MYKETEIIKGEEVARIIVQALKTAGHEFRSATLVYNSTGQNLDSVEVTMHKETAEETAQRLLKH